MIINSFNYLAYINPFAHDFKMSMLIFFTKQNLSGFSAVSKLREFTEVLFCNTSTLHIHRKTYLQWTNPPTDQQECQQKHSKNTVSSQVLKVFPTKIRIFTSPTNLPNNKKNRGGKIKHWESVSKKTREPPVYIFTPTRGLALEQVVILYLTAWYIFFGGGLETSRWHFYVFLEGWLRSNQEFHLSSSDTQWFWLHSLGHGTIPSSKSLDNMYKYTLIYIYTYINSRSKNKKTYNISTCMHIAILVSSLSNTPKLMHRLVLVVC